MVINNFNNTIDRDLEKRILVSIISSDTIIREVANILNPIYFDLNICRKISTWIKKYYDVYHEAPKSNFIDIFNQEKSRLKQIEIDEISDFIDSLPKDQLNEKYLLDKTKNFIKEKSFIRNVEQVSRLLNKKKINEAEKVYRSYGKIINTVSNNCLNPLTDKELLLSVFESKQERLIEFHNEWDDFMGNLRRGHLIGIQGQWKIGKTWVMQEFFFRSLLSKRKVVHISLEMSGKEIIERFIKHLVSGGDEKRFYTFPVFDCKHNQNDFCNSPNRENKKLMPERYFPRCDYKACSFCRKNDRKKYIPAVWFTEILRPGINYHRAEEAIKDFLETYNDNWRLIAYPQFTANSSDIKRDLDILEYKEGFIPDIIIIDYADIMATEQGMAADYRQEELTWMMLKNLADTRNSLVISASQNNRWGSKKANISIEDTGGIARKHGHADGFLSINQTEFEKAYNLMRLGWLHSRHKECNPNKQLLVLRQLECGQPCLDSELVYVDSNGNIEGCYDPKKYFVGD